MRKRLWLAQFIAIFALAVVAFAAARQGAPPAMAPYIPKNMKPYYLVLIVRGEKTPAHADPGHAEIVLGHLAYLRKQAEAGKIALVGPITDEGRIAGISILNAASPDDARLIASGDPLVQSGGATVEVHPILLEDLSSVKFDYPPLP